MDTGSVLSRILLPWRCTQAQTPGQGGVLETPANHKEFPFKSLHFQLGEGGVEPVPSVAPALTAIELLCQVTLPHGALSQRIFCFKGSAVPLEV